MITALGLTPGRIVGWHQCFEGACCLHLQGEKIWSSQTLSFCRVDYFLLKISQCVEGMRLKSNQMNLKEFFLVDPVESCRHLSLTIFAGTGLFRRFQKTNHNRLNPRVCVVRKMKPCYCKWCWYDLGLFAKFGEATINFVMSICLSVRPSVRPPAWDNSAPTWRILTLILLTWRIWWDSNNASRWQIGFNSAFKELMKFDI